MDRFDELQAFVTAADAGSLSAAARKLGRSAPSVTRAVASLEARVGATLLRRTTRSLKLTEAGERYLAVARRVLADLAEAETSTNASVASPRGWLTLTAPVTFGALHVRPVVGAFLARFPEVRVRLMLLDRVVHVIDEGVDVAVRIAHLPDSALVATPVGDVRRVVCASPAYLAAHGTPRDPAELGSHRCIAFTSLTPSDVWTFAGGQGGRSRQVRVQPVLAVNLAEAAIGAAVDGVGITCALSYQVARPLRDGTLVALLEPFAPAPLPVHLVYPAASASTAKVRAFLDVATPALRAALDTGAGARRGRRLERRG
jgi:DNA-binding transcriptional LysR family regulator